MGSLNYSGPAFLASRYTEEENNVSYSLGVAAAVFFATLVYWAKFGWLSQSLSSASFHLLTEEKARHLVHQYESSQVEKQITH